MRKLIAVAAALGLVASLGAAPALAGKKKAINKSFTAQAIPFPNLSSATGTEQSGCAAGQEGVHYTGVDFKAPATGTLKFFAEGFTGDWDLHIFDGDVALARSDAAQVPDMAAAEEEVVVPMKKGQTFTLIACNWMGEPQIEANYSFVGK